MYDSTGYDEPVGFRVFQPCGLSFQCNTLPYIVTHPYASLQACVFPYALM